MALTNPTPRQIQQRKHVADALREYMEENKLSVRTLNERMGVKPQSVMPYNWLACRSLPSEAAIPILSKLLDKPREFFAARPVQRTSSPERPSSPKAAPVQAIAPPRGIHFSMHEDGTATLVFNYTGPAADVLEVLNMVSRQVLQDGLTAPVPAASVAPRPYEVA